MSLNNAPSIPPRGEPFIAPSGFSHKADLADGLLPWGLDYPGPATSGKAKKHSRHKRHGKKKHKKRHRKQRLGAYVLQLIGLICLILAAVKAFEPLTGVGFTLVIVGYKSGLGRGEEGLGGLLDSEDKRRKRSGKSKKRRDRERETDGAEERKLITEEAGDE